MSTFSMSRGHELSMYCRVISFIACAGIALGSHFMVLRIHYLNGMPRNLIYCMLAGIVFKILNFAALPCVQNTLSYSSLAQCQHFSMSRGCQMTELHFELSQAWRVVNGMPRNLIYCMCWYCTLQHFLVFKIHYLTHRLLNVNIFRWAEVVRWLSNILSWSGVTSCQWNAEKSHLLHVLVLHFAALPCVQNTWSYSLLAQCQHFSMSRGCQMIE